MDLSRFPRRSYSAGATALEYLPRFSEALGGPRVWIKRDDTLGLTPSGNKTRKLEFLVGDALAKGADTLITCGAPQSNHCRITLSAAIKEGMACHLVIEERVPGSYHPEAGGNNFLFKLLGVSGITVVPAGADLGHAMQSVAEQVIQCGGRPYIIPGGGSNALGGLGYVACAQELQQQLFEAQLMVGHVVLASGSSGTHGGLLAGFLGNHIDIPIIGIGVSRDPLEQDPLVRREAQAVADLLGLGVTIPAAAVVTFGDWWRPKYSLPNAAMVEAVQMLARTEAILLDPVYTGKAMAGLIGLSRQGHFQTDENVLFLHTGGAPALDVYQSQVLAAPTLSTPRANALSSPLSSPPATPPRL